MERSNFLVSTNWLQEHLTDQNLVIVDCHWDSNAYLRAHIPGALMRPGHSYIKSEVDGHVSKYLPTAHEFTAMAGQLGITQDSLVVCYDEWSNHFATRFWWVAAYYGFNHVKLLDGGWQAWVEAGLPISCKNEGYKDAEAPFETKERPSSNIDLKEVMSVYNDPHWQVVDVRSDEEFSGENSAGNKRGGHIPGALHLEWSQLLSEPHGPTGTRRFLPNDEMLTKLSSVGINREKNIVVHCQSGVRASFMVFCLELLDFPKVRLYDGSMGDWANQDETPLEEGS